MAEITTGQIHAKESKVWLNGIELEVVNFTSEGFTPELVEKTNMKSGGFKEYLSGGGNRGLSGSGVAQYIKTSSIYGAPPAVVNGENVTLKIDYCDGNSTGNFDAIISNLSITCDPKSPEVVTYSFNYVSNGTFTIV